MTQTDGDRSDPLRGYRDRFVIPESGPIYLDGNSLGRLTVAGAERINATVHDEWGHGLVGSWRSAWIGLPEEVGDTLAPIIGATSGEVLIADQTSVNLYKLAWAALSATGRSNIVSDEANFPSDLYVLDAVARAHGGRLRVAPVDPIVGPRAADLTSMVDDDTGVVSCSHVAFKSGARADIAAITAVAHRVGAYALWDLSHSAGVVPVDLDAHGVDLAVGCTYKYLNGGPGAPAFLHVRRDLQSLLASPIPGWFGHADMFAFDPDYSPAAGIRRFGAGTPPIVALRGAQAGIEVVAAAGVDAIRAKSVQLTRLLVDGCDSHLADFGFVLGTPRDPDLRGGHVSLRHPDAYAVTCALLDHGVIADFRTPDTIRLAPSPLYTSFAEVEQAIEIIAAMVSSGAHRDYPTDPSGVT